MQQLNPFVQLLNELKTTNSNKDKETILAKYKDDDYTQQLVCSALNPKDNYFIKKLEPYNEQLYIPNPVLDSRKRYMLFMKLLQKLSTRTVTGNKAKEAVVEVFKQLPKEEYEAYSKVLLKQAIGVGATTVNKVFKDLIPVFDVMLAPSELADLTKVSYPCYTQTKLDGFRTIYLPKESAGLLFSREGIPMANVNLPTYFKDLLNVEDYVLDGELYAEGLNFNQLNSILTSEDKPIPKSLKYVIYDCLTIKEWATKTCTTNYTNRLKKVRELVQSTIANRNTVIDIGNTICNNAKDVLECYKTDLANGYEGSMVKAPLGYYKFKRVSLSSGEMLKLKPFKSADLKVTGFYEGEDKYLGKLGGLLVDYNGVEVKVGSGLSDAQRGEIWNNQAEYLGKVVEVKYFEETPDGSLRFPTFLRMRPDKT